jgi:DNA-binding response OmpR family regulator
MKTPFDEKGPHDAELSESTPAFHSSRTGLSTILLISNDRMFCEALRAFANTIGLLVVQADRTAGTVVILQATKPNAVLLDLDLPDEAAWQVADLVLSEPGCPAVILVTGRTAQFDLQTAIRAGSLVSKNESAASLLDMVTQALEMPDANQLERNAIQRVLIRRIKPFTWAESTPAYRFWGINE